MIFWIERTQELRGEEERESGGERLALGCFVLRSGPVDNEDSAQPLVFAPEEPLPVPSSRWSRLHGDLAPYRKVWQLLAVASVHYHQFNSGEVGPIVALSTMAVTYAAVAPTNHDEPFAVL
jgi:hypothetical protein